MSAPRTIWVPACAVYWQRDVRLRRAHGALPIREWRPVEWAPCEACGEGDLHGPADPRGWMCDGDPLWCPVCGDVSAAALDYDGVMKPLGHEEALDLVTLAAFRRLLGRDPWTGAKRGA